MQAEIGMQRILLIEDDESEVFLLNRMIDEVIPFSYEVVNVNKIVDAINLLNSEAFDLVLLDLNLCDMDGICSLSALHASAPTTPVVVRSGMDNRKLMDEAILGGAHQYLIKGEHDGVRLRNTIEEAVHYNSQTS